MEADLASVLRFVAAHPGSSSARVARQLGLAQSELRRLLLVLGDDPGLGGLGLVQVSDPEGLRRLGLADAGRAWLEQHA